MLTRMTMALVVCSLVMTSCRTVFPRFGEPDPTLTVLPTAIPMAEPDPTKLTKQLQMALAQVRSATVGVNVGGYASGVVISPEGHVLTAAHVALKLKKNQKIWIVFDNGRRAPAKPLGYDAEADIAMFKITEKGTWPSVILAEASPPIGTFCFTLAHPTGYMKNRPAQVRLGRITSFTYKEKKTFIIQADCNIQPGDSGGPLFDMNGCLIGIDSSAAGLVGFNRFGTIDQFHLNTKRLVNGERFGNPALGPTNTKVEGGEVTPEKFKTLRKEFMRRFKIKHRPIVDFTAKHVDDDGRLQISQQQIADALGKDAIPLLHGHAVVLGMDDPAVMNRLPKLPKTAIKPMAIRSGDTVVVMGIPVSSRLLLVKYSEYKKADKSVLRLKPTGPPLKMVGKDIDWDMALVDCGKDAALKPIDLTTSFPSVTAGQGLLSLDQYGRTHWGVVMGPLYEVKKGRSKGPLRDESIVSDRRNPYTRVLPHSLPLFADDACTPIYTFGGRFVGIHAARLNRTTGLIISVNDMNAVVRKMQVAK